MVKRFSTVRRAKKVNKVDKSAKNVDNHAFLCKSMDIKMTQITYSCLSTIYHPHIVDPEKLFIMYEETLQAEIRNEEQREKCIYFRFIHISTEPTTTIIYFLF